MLRVIGKWFISRSADEHIAPPVWMQHYISRDERLRQFEECSRQLAERLQSESTAWAKTSVAAHERGRGHQSITIDHRQRTRAILRWSWPLAACAAVAVAIVCLHPYIRRNDHALPIRPISSPIADATRRDRMPHDKLAHGLNGLLSALDTGRSRMNAWREQSTGLRGDLQALGWQADDVLVRPAEVAGVATGRMLATLDRGLQARRHQLASDMRSAMSFLAVRLPASAAHLMGHVEAASLPTTQDL
jgi:hypothetical protein